MHDVLDPHACQELIGAGLAQSDRQLASSLRRVFDQVEQARGTLRAAGCRQLMLQSLPITVLEQSLLRLRHACLGSGGLIQSAKFLELTNELLTGLQRIV